jgi:hypothetical protein
LMRQLGFNPGNDVIQRVLARGDCPDEKFTAGQWIVNLPEMKLLTADIDTSGLHRDDLKPSGHGHTLMALPPDQQQQIGKGRAAELVRTYGAAIDLPRDDRPPAATAFVSAIEDLDYLLTKSVFKAVYTAAHAPPSVAALKLDNLGSQLMDDLPKRRSEVGDIPIWYYQDFKDLGLIDPAANSRESMDAIRSIRQRVAAHVAGMLIKLEDMRGLPGDTEEDKAGRIRILEQIIHDRTQPYAPAVTIDF